MFAAPPFLQGLKQRVHLAFGLVILNGQQHPGLEIHQMGRHDDKFAGHLQIKLLPPGHPVQILVQQKGNLDVPNLDLVFA